jgi:hypothetical protein
MAVILARYESKRLQKFREAMKGGHEIIAGGGRTD